MRITIVNANSDRVFKIEKECTYCEDCEFAKPTSKNRIMCALPETALCRTIALRLRDCPAGSMEECAERYQLLRAK